MRYTTESFIAKSREKHGDTYIYDKVIYRNSNTKVTIGCKIHGYFDVLPWGHISGATCAKCYNSGKNGAKFRDTKETFIKKAIVTHGNRYDYSLVEYINSRTHVTILCKEHGAFKQIAKSHIAGKNCPQCAQKTIGEKLKLINRHTLEQFVNSANNVHNNFYDYSKSKYINASKDIIITCPTHGDFTQRPGNHIYNKNGCPSCCINNSKKENALYTYIKTLCPNAIKNYVYYLNGKSKREFDIYCPDHKVAFELNGLFWHSHLSLLNSYKYKNITINDADILAKSKQLTKTIEAEKLGIRLIHIWEDEWDNKQSIVKKYIEYVLGTPEKIFARKCKLEKISSLEAKEFYDATHIQGSNYYSVNYGLKYNNELIACMSFIEKNNIWELIRFSTSKTVIGGASKLFNAFTKEKSPNTVFSFCERRMFTGNVYTKLGFKLDSISRPDYFVTYANKRYSRQWVQKKYLKKRFPDIYSDSKTELQLCSEIGIGRIYGCGHLKFVWKQP